MDKHMQDWIFFCSSLRDHVIKRGDNRDTFLLANFSGTLQQKDIEARTKLIQDFFRVKINVKAFNNPGFDFRDTSSVFEAMGKEFDMPYWAFHALKSGTLADFNNTFIYQLKACNEHCPWCYVDDENKNGLVGNGGFFSIPSIVDAFVNEREKQTLNVIRPSGGEPTLAIEQWLELLRELDSRGLSQEVYVQADTNLTTGSFIHYLESSGLISHQILNGIGNFKNIGVLCSFKGTDKKSFLEATGLPKRYSFLEEERFDSLAKLISAGIDVYPFIYDPNPDTLVSFMEKGAKRFGDGFYLKTWVLPLKLYGPEKERLRRKHKNQTPEAYQGTLDQKFRASEEIMQDLIYHRFGLNYHAVPRPGIELRTS